MWFFLEIFSLLLINDYVWLFDFKGCIYVREVIVLIFNGLNLSSDIFCYFLSFIFILVLKICIMGLENIMMFVMLLNSFKRRCF